MLVHARVSYNIDFINSSRFSLVHTHFKIDRVILYINLHGFHIEEEIAAVCVQFAHSVVIRLEPFIESLEIIHISGFDTEGGIQQFVGIDGISDPFDRAYVVFVSLAESDIHINPVWVLGVRHYAVRNDVCVAVTILVVFVNDGLFVFFVFGGDEFLGAEEVDDMVVIRFLHRFVDLQVTQRFVPRQVDFSYLCLYFLIHCNQNADIARVIGVGFLNDMYIGVMETFFGKVFLDNRLGMIFHVRSHLATLADTGLDFQILPFALLESLESHFADTRTLLQLNDEPYF